MLGPTGQNPWAQIETSPRVPVPHLLPPHILLATCCATDNTADSLNSPARFKKQI